MTVFSKSHRDQEFNPCLTEKWPLAGYCISSPLTCLNFFYSKHLYIICLKLYLFIRNLNKPVVTKYNKHDKRMI